ncbi:coiled-coil domain-containing protein 149 [Plutella xylostella]|uniref:coiled-coil domain-containing protein 149 n=1 Tax=Plutella xylostella TaxID=51655 RepID=UPI002032A792|nr:coiled-coil domain-containing protein 149 [Plutella xylostella]
MFTKNSKVKFQEQDQQLDDYVLENAVLKSKLQSKMEALSIMSAELDRVSMQRDRSRELVAALRGRAPPAPRAAPRADPHRIIPNNTLRGGDLLASTREHNTALKLEVETLRGRLEEATGDIAALRKQLQQFEHCSCGNNPGQQPCSNSDYEDLVQQLEKINKKYKQMQLDYRATLDEKEELITDRDYYKSKVQRLNHQISAVSNKSKGQGDEAAEPAPVVDVDGLLTENKYLHERITQMQVEKEILKRTLTKYKALLENRNKDSVNLKKGFLDVMTQKQVREYLDTNSKTGLKRASVSELKSLSLGLLEALSDKSTALQHQRRTNQLLAARLAQLERTQDLPTAQSDEDVRTEEEEDSKHIIKTKYSDSESDDGGRGSEGSAEGGGGWERPLGRKTVLPRELELLVKEALAEMRPSG